MKYNVYRKKFTSPRSGETHYRWSVLSTEPVENEYTTFEKVGEVEREEGEGRVALQTRVNDEYGDPTPTNDIGEGILNILSDIVEGNEYYE